MVIYYDRVAATSKSTVLLGYTIAHEVGHILLGTDSHTPSGVMRAHWRGSDYSEMNAHLLTFAARDADMMRINVRQKARYCMAEAANSSRVNGRAAEE